MTAQHHAPLAPLAEDALQLEVAVFAAKVRASRAILGLSQSEFAARVGLTQKSVHQIERLAVEPKRRTVRSIEDFWRSVGLSFDELPDGGFRIVVPALALQAPLQDEPASSSMAKTQSAAHIL